MKNLFTCFCLALFLFSCHPPQNKISSSKSSIHSTKGLYLVNDEVVEGMSDPQTLQSSAFSPSGNHKDWKRIHQLLFNQVVKVVDTQANAFQVEVKDLKVQPDRQKPPESLRMWVAASALTSIKGLEQRKVFLKNIPHFHSSAFGKVSLKIPHSTSSKVYSAGTQFVVSKLLKDRVEVFAFDKQSMGFQSLHLPKQSCYFHGSRTFQEKFRDYMNLLRSWAHLQKGFIPYVFGGASWQHTQFKNRYFSKGTGYYRPSSHKIPTGMDCSSMIYLACQCVDIPFYAKNTTAMLHRLQPLSKGQHIEVGDIIWVPGHVQVISRSGVSPQLIEARGYTSGIGKIHEIALSKAFKGIKSLRSLEEAYFKNKELVFLNQSGKEYTRFKSWKILKFKSLLSFSSKKR